ARTQTEVFLGQTATGATPPSGCDDDGGDRRAHTFRPNLNNPALALARSPGRQKDFHRPALCCNAALALPQLMAKLYAEFFTPIIWAEREPSSRRRKRHRGNARFLHRRRCSAKSRDTGADDRDHRCAVPPP